MPYLGTYLSVLTMLDTALPDTVKVMSEINFSVTAETESLCLVLVSFLFLVSILAKTVSIETASDG